MNKGQALIPVLIIMLITMILGVGVLHLSIGSLLLNSYWLEGEKVLMATEGALENGLMRILRNPGYSGESLQINEINCTIETSGQAPVVMTAECSSLRSKRRLQAEVSFINGEMLVSNYQEVE